MLKQDVGLARTSEFLLHCRKEVIEEESCAKF